MKLDFLAGYKTYVIKAVDIVVVGLYLVGVIDMAQLAIAVTVLAGLGLPTIAAKALRERKTP